MDRTNVIGEKVKSLRTAKEISLEELADRTGLAVEQITRIEENIDIPSLAPLVKLAIFLFYSSLFKLKSSCLILYFAICSNCFATSAGLSL